MPVPHPLRALKALEGFLVFNLQLYNNLDSCGEYSLRTWIEFFFHPAIYNRKCAYLSFKNSIPLQLRSVQWSLFRLWQLKKEEIECVFLTPYVAALQVKNDG